MVKKKNRRSQVKYPALDPRLNLKTRFEQIDFDYVDKLPENWTDPKTGKKYNLKEYLNNFVNEYVHADFRKTRVHKKKKVESEKNKEIKKLSIQLIEKIKEFTKIVNDSNVSVSNKTKIKKNITKFKNLLKHQLANQLTFIEDFYKTESYRRNNFRNSCVLTRARAQGLTLGLDDLHESFGSEMNEEDQMIAKLDLMRKLQNSGDGSDNG